MSALAALLTLAALQSPTGDRHLLVVSGIGGEPAYRERFYEWGATMVDAAHDRLGLPEANVVFLAERTERDPDRIDDRSTKENIEAALAAMAQRAAADDVVAILFIGHGSMQGDEARFSIPGPDVTAADLNAMLAQFPTQTIVVVNAASASGAFVGPLAGPNRVILTSTKTGFEANESHFGGFFVEAFAGDGADVDKDERVSILEAFTYARLQVRRLYEDDNRLLTEHAVLDDDGDGEGSDDPDGGDGDGALARTLFLDRAGVVAAGPTGGDSVLVALYEEKRELESRIATLRNLRGEMEEAAYEAELEELLVELAMKNREIRAREGGR